MEGRCRPFARAAATGKRAVSGHLVRPAVEPDRHRAAVADLHHGRVERAAVVGDQTTVDLDRHAIAKFTDVRDAEDIERPHAIELVARGGWSRHEKEHAEPSRAKASSLHVCFPKNA